MRLFAASIPVLLCAAPAHAEPQAPARGRAIDLAWTAPQGCPSRDAVLAEVRSILTGSTPRAAVARAEVTRLAPERWSVHLVTVVGETPGERSFEADSCAAVASATALIVAWTIDPHRATAPAPGPTVRAAPPGTEAEGPRSSSWPRVSGLVALSAQGDLGTLPEVAGAAEVTAGVIVGRLRAEFSGSAWGGEDAARGASEGTHLRMLDAAARACWRGTLGRALEIDPCLGAGIAHVASDGFGETSPYQREASWVLGRGDVVATWVVVGPVALRALVGVAVPFTRPSFVLLDAQGGTVPLHQPAVASLRGALGVELRFP